MFHPFIDALKYQVLVKEETIDFNTMTSEKAEKVLDEYSIHVHILTVKADSQDAAIQLDPLKQNLLLTPDGNNTSKKSNLAKKSLTSIEASLPQNP